MDDDDLFEEVFQERTALTQNPSIGHANDSVRELFASLMNIAFDPQIEPKRFQWLYDELTHVIIDSIYKNLANEPSKG